MHPISRLLLVSFATIAPLAAQSVLRTVDDDAPADFATLDDAIAASGPGDVLLVRSGSYEPFTMAGIGVTILAEDNAVVTISGTSTSSTSTIRDVPAGQVALLRGIELTPEDTGGTTSASTIGPLLHIANCRGVVQVEDVVADARPTTQIFFSIRQGEAVLVEASDRVVFVRLDADGSPGTTFVGQEFASRALTCVDSSTFAHGCSFESSVTFVEGSLGQPGIEVRGGLLVLRDSSVTAGPGGSAGATGPPSGGMGGAGILASQFASVWSIGSSLSGGAGGGGTLFGGPAGSPGVAFELTGGASLTELPAQPTSLEATPIVRVDPVTGGPGTIDLRGVPNATSVLIVDLGPTPAFVPFFPGFLGVSVAALAIPAGTTDASGQLSVPLVAPQLPGLNLWQLAVQFATASPAGVLDLSNPSIMTILQ